MAPRKKQQAERRPRRKPGTGTIRYKKDRQQWEAEFKLPGGGSRYSYHDSVEEAGAALDALVKARDEEKRNLSGGSQSVGSYLQKWLEYKASRVKAKTLHNYTDLIGYMGYIRDIRLDELQPEHVSAMLDGLRREGLGSSVLAVRNVLRNALNTAIGWRYITFNVAGCVEAPVVERRAAIALTELERTVFLGALVGDPLEALYHLYSRLGLRKGEGLGLRWCDIDWKTGTITINQQYTNVGSKVVQSTPKTKRSVRRVPVPADILALIERLPRSHELVFASRAGTPISPRNIIRHFKAALKRAGLPKNITIHDLRHTALYLMETAGAAPSALQAIAGHSSQTMTRHYVDHADLAAMRRAVEYRPAQSA